MPVNQPKPHQGYLRTQPDLAAEIYVEPSHEARFLLKHLSWLVSPADQRGSLPSRLIRSAMVAPFTQLTFFSFDLQAFLFQIFHQTKVARFGHFTFMIGVNFFLMSALSQFTLSDSINGGTLYAAVLLLWYSAVALQTRLHAWMLVSLPSVALLYLGSQAYMQAFALTGNPWWTPTAVAYNPWLWMWFSAFLIAVSHAPEPRLPPRAAEPMTWISVPDFILGRGTRHNPLTMLVHAVRTGLFLVWGTLDEWWASPRLMPYNFLMLMFEAGYAPERYAELKRRADSAIAHGNPAIDYVGTGGGTFMQLPQ